MKMKRFAEPRWIPQGSAKVASKNSDCVASYASASKVEQVVIDGVPVGYKPQSWTAYA